MGFFGENTKCDGLFRTLDGQDIECFLGRNHKVAGISHRGRTESGIWIQWKDGVRGERAKMSAPIETWRAWKIFADINITPRQYMLKSAFVDFQWDSPVARTKENKEVDWENKRESDRTDPGVYSYKNPWLLLHHNKNGSSQNEFYGFPVFGRGLISGHAVEHELGYRSQKFTIQELWVRRSCAEWQYPEIDIIKLQYEALYQCPVHILEEKQIEPWAKFYTPEEFFTSEYYHNHLDRQRMKGRV